MNRCSGDDFRHQGRRQRGCRPGGGLVRALEIAAQVADQADAQIIQLRVVLARQLMQRLRTEQPAMLDMASVGGGIAAEITEISGAFESDGGIHVGK